MTSFAPPTCADCRQEVIRVTSAKTGRKIRLDPVPTIDGTFEIRHEMHGKVASFVPPDQRARMGNLWVAHASSCPSVKASRPPKRQTPRTLTLGFAGTEGTAPELALARTQAHTAELQLDRLADELLIEWRTACRSSWVPVWKLLPGFLARRGADLPKAMREKLSTVVGRKLHPEAAAKGDRHRQNVHGGAR